jgi:hypothetical protein
MTEVIANYTADSVIAVSRSKRKFTEPEENAFFENLKKTATDCQWY